MTGAARLAGAFLASLLVACGGDDEGGRSGGGGGGGSAGQGGAAGSGGSGGSPPIGSAIVDVVVEETDGVAADPTTLTFAQAFVAGDVPESLVVTDGDTPLPTQVDVKRRHGDGSVRHAVISVETPSLGANESRTLTIKSAGAPGEAPKGLSVAEALAEGFDATVNITEGGAAYSASVADILQGGPPARWLDGELVTELRASGPLSGGGADHPALNVVVSARFDDPSRARVSVTIENAWHDAPGNLTYDVDIQSEGAAVLTETNVEHFHHARWRNVHHFGSAPATLRARHDIDYLIATGALPRYDTTRTLTDKAVSDLTSSWAASNRDLLGNGIVIEYFPTTGGRGDIGPLPEWTAIALLSADAGAMDATMGVGDLAGSFSVHYRDRDTGRAISLEEWPTISLIPAAAKYSEEDDKLPDCSTCTSPYTVDAAHQPSLAFVPYLLTGDAYYLDELYFWTSYNFIAQNWDYRGKGEGLLERQQVRAQAWTLRTLAHTAWIAPEADPEASYLEERVQNNLDWYAANAVGSNSFGWWGEQSNLGSDGGRPDANMDPDVRYYTSPWQSDFLIWAFDYTHGLGYTDAAATRDWLALYTVGRLTNGPAYSPYDGAPYHIATSSVSGTQYSTWDELWQMSFAGRTDSPPTEFKESGCALCYPAIARVALTGALHGNVDGASDAWDFLDAELKKKDDIYNDDPTWAIVP